MNITLLSYSTAWLMLISALFLPKINFIDLGGSTYIRLDDFLVALFVSLKIPRYSLAIFQLDFIPKWLMIFFCFVGASFFSSIINGLLFDRIDTIQGLLYSVRHLEYLIYVYAGCEFAKYNINLYRIFFWLTWYLLILVILQNSGIINSFSDFSTERASGNTAGPFELAVIASFLLIYFSTEQSRRKTRLITMIAAAILLLLTQSRITIAGTIFILAHLFIFRSNLYQKQYLYIGGAALATSLALYMSIAKESTSFLARFTTIFYMDIGSIWNSLNSLPLIDSASKYFELAYDELLVDLDNFEGDTSAFIRFFRWSLLISMIFSSPELILFGAGPSFASVAVDGYYVRLLTETGLLGLTSYTIFTYYILKFSSPKISMQYYIIVMIFTAMFIDIFTSSKAMFLFWFWFGYSIWWPRKMKSRKITNEILDTSQRKNQPNCG